jgi:hypothetical protein
MAIFRYQTCIPTATGIQNKTVSVWLYPIMSNPGPVTAECAVSNLEEHTECQCGCAISADSCAYNQRFQESKCACTCLDTRARSSCYNRPGWHWNEATCQCMCLPVDQWPQCATGYQFDPIMSCSCISVSEDASPILLILIIILIAGVSASGLSLLHCHKKNIGLFSYKRREIIMKSIRHGDSENTNVNI